MLSSKNTMLVKILYNVASCKAQHSPSTGIKQFEWRGGFRQVKGMWSLNKIEQYKHAYLLTSSVGIHRGSKVIENYWVCQLTVGFITMIINSDWEIAVCQLIFIGKSLCVSWFLSGNPCVLADLYWEIPVCRLIFIWSWHRYQMINWW